MKKISLLIIVLFALSSCEKLLMPIGNKHSVSQVFDDLWKTMDQGYAYFDEKKLPWGDSLRADYQFRLYDTMTDEQFFDTCAKFIAMFQDENISLNAGFRSYRYNPRVKEPANFNRSLLERKYLANAQHTGPFWHTVIDSVAYIYYEDFNRQVTDEHLDILLRQFRDSTLFLYGVVFDVRNNAGGNPENMFPILKRMGVDTSFRYNTLLYKTVYKNGPAQNEFTDLQGAFIEQSPGAKFPENFVLLTNKGTKGIGNIFAVSCRAFSNVRIMGDSTGGGIGFSTGRELPNGWILEYPSLKVFDSENEPTYYGIAPDDSVHMNRVDEDNDIDTIIETAIRRIKTI